MTVQQVLRAGRSMHYIVFGLASHDCISWASEIDVEQFDNFLWGSLMSASALLHRWLNKPWKAWWHFWIRLIMSYTSQIARHTAPHNDHKFARFHASSKSSWQWYVHRPFLEIVECQGLRSWQLRILQLVLWCSFHHSHRHVIWNSHLIHPPLSSLFKCSAFHDVWSTTTLQH